MTRALLFRALLFLVLLSAFGAWADERLVAAVEDPRGDDDGDGALVYPQRADFQPGDLDLVSLRIVRSDAAYRFEASFRNPIRDPAGITGDVGPETLDQFARRGFYAFNLDLYLDLDRVAGSGNTYTLPGRHLTLDAGHAWEKAIVLTPRPELMRRQLIDAVVQSEGARDADAVAARIDRMILFPTAVSVRQRSISFVVPAAFLAGGRPDTDWSLTAFVTGARTSVAAELSLAASPAGALERLPLGVMQPKAGRPRDSFGYSGAAVPSPVVDLLAPAPLDQHALLSGASALAGIALTAGGAATIAGDAVPTTSLSDAGERAPAATPEPAAARPGGTIAERLRELNDLRAQGLIDAGEYEELRRKILSDM